MSRLLLATFLLSAGCADLVGPRKRALNPVYVDPRGLPMPEQHYWGRAALAFPSASPLVGPRTWNAPPEDQWGQLSH